MLSVPRERAKVFACITNRDRLLVFVHPDHPAANAAGLSGLLPFVFFFFLVTPD